MPFKSKAQRAFLAINKPKVAREFAAATPSGVKLPERVTPKVTTLANAYRGRRA